MKTIKSIEQVIDELLLDPTYSDIEFEEDFKRYIQYKNNKIMKEYRRRKIMKLNGKFNNKKNKIL